MTIFIFSFLAIPFSLKIIYDIRGTLFQGGNSMKTTPKEKNLYFVIIFLIVVLGGGHVKNYYDTVVQKSNEGEKKHFVMDSFESQSAENPPVQENKKESTQIMVHISGAVVNPGVVTLDVGKRVKDVIDIAGGVYDSADLDQVNLAKIVEDEQKIYIPRKGENLLTLGGQDSSMVNMHLIDSKTMSNGKVNINQCTKSELIELPGIGEKTAEKILEYRKEHGFSKIEDIMQVKGIGPKKFEKIKDMICTR